MANNNGIADLAGSLVPTKLPHRITSSSGEDVCFKNTDSKNNSRVEQTTQTLNTSSFSNYTVMLMTITIIDVEYDNKYCPVVSYLSMKAKRSLFLALVHPY